MIWAFFTALGIAVGAIWICTRLARNLRLERKRVRDYQSHVEALRKELREREAFIQQMEEVNRETAKKKDRLHRGSDTERFDASLDILHELSGDPGDRTSEDTD